MCPEAERQGRRSLEARELAALFVLEELLTVHSAHQFDTSLEAFYRMRVFLIENTPELDQQVKRVTRRTVRRASR